MSGIVDVLELNSVSEFPFVLVFTLTGSDMVADVEGV